MSIWFLDSKLSTCLPSGPSGEGSQWQQLHYTLTLWGRKATIVALIVVNKINFLKKCALKTSTQTAVFPHMNGLLLRGFWHITCYTYAYNIP